MNSEGSSRRAKTKMGWEFDPFFVDSLISKKKKKKNG